MRIEKAKAELLAATSGPGAIYWRYTPAISTVLAALERAERRVAELEGRKISLPALPNLGSGAEWDQGFAAGAEGMRNECLLAITAAGFSAEKVCIKE